MMSHPRTNRPENPFLANNGSMFGACDDDALTRLFEVTQGNVLQPDRTSFENSQHVTNQFSGQASRSFNGTVAYPHQLSSLTSLFNSYPFQQTSDCASVDSAYITASSGYHTRSPLDIGDQTFNVDIAQEIQKPDQIYFSHQNNQYIIPERPVQNKSFSHADERLAVPMLASYQPNDSAFRPSKQAKRRKTSFGSNEGSNIERETKRARLSPSHLIGASTEQQDKLQQYLSEWEKRDRLPSEKELRAISTLTEIPFYKVAMWYGDKLRLAPKAFDSPILMPPSDTDPEVLRDIVRYVDEAAEKECSTSHSRKAAGGKYSCTWSCGYSTDYRDAWIRHEEKRQPQKFWHCISCQAMRKTGERKDAFIAHRRDKFLPHAKSFHPLEDANELRTKSKVSYDAPFDRTCNFLLKSTGETCNHTFANWKERNEHYLRHYEETISHDSSDNLDTDSSSDDDRDDSDDNDYDGDDGKGGKRKGTLPAHKSNINTSLATFSGLTTTPGTYSRRPNGQNESSRGCISDGCSRKMRKNLANFDVDGCESAFNDNGLRSASDCHREDPGEAHLAAQRLIHIDSYTVVEAKPGSRYIALKYSALEGATSAYVEVSQQLPYLSLPPVNELTPAFRKIFDLARDMGFQYLWIDIFCRLNKGIRGPDLAYRQATLILVVGHHSQRADWVWHFICDYHGLEMVQFWEKQTVSFHHLQQLGHGAYSVVDKVELRPTHEIFARKIVFRTSTKQALHLREIEIMQKLRHPHIASFVAAYYDRNGLNILMSPVADCDMRTFLICPDQFPGKCKYLPQWFISLAEALAYMHGKSCRHKDIKPANILISGKKVLLADFGTSMDFSTTQSTSAGSALMTPKYSAPEVSRNGKRGRSADIFSLGCVFVEMATVAVGKTLNNLHDWLNMEQESRNCHATYHNHLPRLSLWLQGLNALHSDEDQYRILQTTLSMLNEDSRRRPTAVEITKALCSQSPLHVRPATSRRCYPLPAPAVAMLDHSTSNPLQQNILKLPTLPEQNTMVAFVTVGLWNKFGSISKDKAACVVMTFKFQSSGRKVERYCPFLRWIDLVTWIIRIIWNNCAADFEHWNHEGASCSRNKTAEAPARQTGKITTLSTCGA